MKEESFARATARAAVRTSVGMVLFTACIVPGMVLKGREAAFHEASEAAGDWGNKEFAERLDDSADVNGKVGNVLSYSGIAVALGTAAMGGVYAWRHRRDEPSD